MAMRMKQTRHRHGFIENEADAPWRWNRPMALSTQQIESTAVVTE